jgi:succinate dehydrogenase / fumarate reductase cytochrome b subunit
MNVANVFTSSVGKKFIMAITGLALFLFVVAHLAGNLQIFLRPEVINRYGHFLQTNTELIWPARIILLVLVALHIWAAIKLTVENRAARPQPYAHYEVVAASYASRTMIWSGLIILVFIIYHLLHFTALVQAVNFTGQNFEDLKAENGQHDIFAMMVLGFRNPIVAVFYIFAMFLLFLHLGHGVAAMFQSLGWKSPAYQGWIEKFAYGISWLLFLGYISIPIAIQLGYGHAYLVERGLVK